MLELTQESVSRYFSGVADGSWRNVAYTRFGVPLRIMAAREANGTGGRLYFDASRREIVSGRLYGTTVRTNPMNFARGVMYRVVTHVRADPTALAEGGLALRIIPAPVILELGAIVPQTLLFAGWENEDGSSFAVPGEGLAFTVFAARSFQLESFTTVAMAVLEPLTIVVELEGDKDHPARKRGKRQPASLPKEMPGDPPSGDLGLDAEASTQEASQ